MTGKVKQNRHVSFWLVCFLEANLVSRMETERFINFLFWHKVNQTADGVLHCQLFTVQMPS